MDNGHQLLEVNKLRKEYPRFSLGDLTFQGKKGDVIAFLGQNGAGKSTLFQLLSGNLDPSSGSIKFLSKILTPNHYYLKKNIGYLPQKLSLPQWVTGNEILNYAADLFALENKKEVIKDAMLFWDCIDYANKPLGTCSHGMKKRVALALANIHQPKLLIVDEPFSGLDLFHIQALHKKIEERSQADQVTIMSTHIASYVARLCNKVYLIENGSLFPFENWENLEFIDKINDIEKRFHELPKATDC